MLYQIQTRFVDAKTIEEFNAAMSDFIHLQNEVDTWIPRISVSHYYQVVRSLEYVKKIAQERKTLLESRAPQ